MDVAGGTANVVGDPKRVPRILALTSAAVWFVALMPRRISSGENMGFGFRGKSIWMLGIEGGPFRISDAGKSKDGGTDGIFNGTCVGKGTSFGG